MKHVLVSPPQLYWAEDVPAELVAATPSVNWPVFGPATFVFLDDEAKQQVKAMVSLEQAEQVSSLVEKFLNAEFSLAELQPALKEVINFAILVPIKSADADARYLMAFEDYRQTEEWLSALAGQTNLLASVS